MGVEQHAIVLPHGITLSCRLTGKVDAGRRIVFLHGFPEGAFIWDELMMAFAGEARCIAPNLRGYERSSAPLDVQAYRAKYLVADLEALVRWAGAPVDVLVAHDWGGGVAWNFAALRPDLLRQLLIINSPHPGALLRELRDNPAQRRASAYMNELCRPDAAALLSRNHHAALLAMFGRRGDAAWLTPTMRRSYQDLWSCGLNGPLNYYRASPLKPVPDGDDTLHRIELPSSVINVRVPTTVVWGMRDHALLPGLLDGLDRWVSPLRIVRVDRASHWIVHEQPSLVIDAIRRALSAA